MVLAKALKAWLLIFAKYGADKVYVVEGDVFANYNTGAFVAQIAAMIQEYNPNAILFAHTFNGRDFASRLAQKSWKLV